MITIEKYINTDKENIPLVINYQNYGFNCIFAFFILIYVTVVHIGERDNFFTLLCMFFLSIFFVTRLKIWKLKKAYKERLLFSKTNLYKLKFSDTLFSYGYDGGIIVNVPYCNIIDYKLTPKALLLQAGQYILKIDINIFSQEEIVNIEKTLSKLKHIKRTQGLRSRLDRNI